MKKKRIIVIGMIAITWATISSNQVQAALQANPTTHVNPVSKAGASWITEIRQMETVGQTMGLEETLDGLNATSQSNNIDVHMMLPNEYSAVAILSISGYGNAGKLRDESDIQKRTTTGNATGVYFTGDRWEVLAGTNDVGAGKYTQETSPSWQDLLTWNSSDGGAMAHRWLCRGYGILNDTGEYCYGFGGEGLFSTLYCYGTQTGGHWTNCWANTSTGAHSNANMAAQTSRGSVISVPGI